jgi:hypothetical protein
MRTIAFFLAAFVVLATITSAQDEPRPGVQAPGFWLISPTNPTAGAVGLECVENMLATYTVVFPETSPTLGQTLVVTKIDEESHRVYTTWQTVGGTTPNVVQMLVDADVDLPVIPQNSTHTLLMNVPGVELGSVVTVQPNTDLPDGIVIGSARVVEGGKVAVRVMNVSAAAIDCDATQWSIASTQRARPMK